jgi:hypothetical protein
MSLESMLAGLTPQEKLHAMNILWRDLSANPAGVRGPDWHGDVLAERIKVPSQKPRLPLDAAFDDVSERLNERRTPQHEAARFEYQRLDLWIIVLRGYEDGVPA